MRFRRFPLVFKLYVSSGPTRCSLSPDFRCKLRDGSVPKIINSREPVMVSSHVSQLIEPKHAFARPNQLGGPSN